MECRRGKCVKLGLLGNIYRKSIIRIFQIWQNQLDLVVYSVERLPMLFNRDRSWYSIILLIYGTSRSVLPCY